MYEQLVLDGLILEVTKSISDELRKGNTKPLVEILKQVSPNILLLSIDPEIAVSKFESLLNE